MFGISGSCEAPRKHHTVAIRAQASALGMDAASKSLAWRRVAAETCEGGLDDPASRLCPYPGELVPMSESGQKAKYSLRADVFRFVSESGLKSDIARRSRHVSEVPQPDSSNRQVRTFRDLFLITELLDSKAESDDVGFEAELARMSCQIERAFRFVEVLKKAAADPSNRSSIDPPLFRLSRSGSNSCCQSSLSIVS